MASFGGILSIARGAMTASQAAVQIASHNISNANTAGYSRQREVLSENAPERTPAGIFGTGVTITTVQRSRDLLLDQEYRSSSGDSGAASMRSSYLQRVEGIFNEPSDTGLSSALDAFYNAWSDLASDPTNVSTRTGVQQAGAALARQFNTVTSQLESLKTETVTRAQALVTDVNRQATQIAELNARIVSQESNGATAGDLRDQRDAIIDTLSSTASVRVIEHSDGSVQVLMGSVSLVDGQDAKQVQLSASGTLSYKIVGSADSIRNIGGALSALQDVYNTDVTDAQTKLDAMATALITDVNALHRTGWSPAAGATGNWDPLAGPTGSNVDFFDADPANASAGRIRLSAAVDASPGAVAAGSALNEKGNNSIALAMAALRDGAPSAADGTFAADFRSIVGTVAGTLNEVKNSAEVYSTLVDQSDQRRTAVFGVSVDEELIQIMRQQQAYAAASKIVKTVDEMMQTLLSLKQ